MVVPVALCAAQRLQGQAAVLSDCLPSHLYRRVCADRAALGLEGLDGGRHTSADAMRQVLGVALLAVTSVQVLTHSNLGMALPNSGAKIAFLRAGRPVPGLLYEVVDAVRLTEPVPAHSKLISGSSAEVHGLRGRWKSCTPLSAASSAAILQADCSRGPGSVRTSVAAWLGAHVGQGVAELLSLSCFDDIGDLIAWRRLPFVVLPFPTRHNMYEELRHSIYRHVPTLAAEDNDSGPLLQLHDGQTIAGTLENIADVFREVARRHLTDRDQDSTAPERVSAREFVGYRCNLTSVITYLLYMSFGDPISGGPNSVMLRPCLGSKQDLGERLRVEGALQSLDCLILNMTANGQVADRRTYGSLSGRFSTVYLVRMLMLADLVKNDNDLKQAVLLAIDSVIPSVFRDQFVDIVQQQRQPSSSTITRYRLNLDVAHMLIMRDTHVAQSLCSSGLPVRYLLADASEQAGIDWELLHQVVIARDDLYPAFDAQTSLVMWRREIREAWRFGPGQYI